MYLTIKKQRFVDFIKSFTITNNRPPTFVEIMDGLGFKSLGTINWYVNELEKEGILKRIRGHNGKRALSVLEKNIHNTLPLLGLITAGAPLEVFEDTEQIEVPPSYLNENNYVLKVKGDSMIDDHIQDGDFIIVRKTEIANNGELVVAYVNNEATLKRYYTGANGAELHPRNPEYSIISINPEDDFRIGGIVMGIFRRYN